MDVLGCGVGGERAGLQIAGDALQALHDELGLGRLDDALAAQHGGVGDAALDILLRHAGVKGNGGVKVVDLVIGLLLKPSSP